MLGNTIDSYQIVGELEKEKYISMDDNSTIS